MPLNLKVKVLVTSVVSDSLQPHELLLPIRLLCPWNSPGKNTGVGCHSSQEDLPNPGVEPGSPALQADSLPSELPGKLAATAPKSLQSCLALCNPIDIRPPGSLTSLGFSRQEHWSGLPFPSPVHESEK